MTEEQKFKVVDRMQGYELRSYQPCVVAEVEISAKFETAANEAFRYLINYIGGKNEARQCAGLLGEGGLHHGSWCLWANGPVR